MCGRDIFIKFNVCVIGIPEERTGLNKYCKKLTNKNFLKLFIDTKPQSQNASRKNTPLSKNKIK